jgi:autotransporter-associated beta strand protein
MMRLRTNRALQRVILAAGALAASGLGRWTTGANLYWDGGDASAANNNAATGAGLGGAGSWNNLGSANWWDSVAAADQAWNNANNDAAIFWGPTVANISLAGPVTVSTLNFRTSGYGIIGAQEMTLSGAATVNVENGNATLSSILVGANGLTKAGSGVLVQNNINNTYTGGTFVNGGVLAISAETINAGDKAQLGIVPANNLTPGSGLTLNGTTLRIDSHFNPGPPAPATFGPNRRIDLGPAGGTFDVGTNLTLVLGDEGGGNRASGGVYTSAGGHLTKTGAGRVAVGKNTANALHNYVGLTIRQGTWAIFQTDTVGNPVGAQPPANPGSAAVARAYGLVLDYNGAGSGAILQFRGYGFGGVPRTDITLSNSRPILIGAGGGTIDTNGSATSHGGVGGVAGSGTYSGILSLGAAGTGVLTKTGDGEFYHYGDANYGGLTITRGSWAIDGETQLGGTISPLNVTLDNGAGGAPGTQPATLRIVQPGVSMLAPHTLTVGPGGGTICVDNSVNWNGALVGSGTLTKGGYTGTVASPLIGKSAGTGTLVLSSDSPGFNGSVIVDAGALIVNNTSGSATGDGAVTVNAGAMFGGEGTVSGNVTNSGTVAPGSGPGTLTLGGDYSQQTGGQLQIELASASNFDKLVVGGSASFAGTLAVSLVGGFSPAFGDVFTIVTAGSRTGTFGTTVLPALSGDLAWEVNYATTSVSLSIVLPGDFNHDGMVNAADYVVWRKSDGPEDDYDAWKANFGESSGSGSLSDSTVPEPASRWLLILGALIWRRRLPRDFQQLVNA